MCAATIFVLTSIPGSAIPDAPRGTDKVTHLAMYGTLGYLAGTAAGTVLGPAAGAIAMGAFDEWHQQFIPRRSMDVRDWVADSIGAVLGVGLAALRRRRRRGVTGSPGGPTGTRTDQLR